MVEISRRKLIGSAGAMGAAMLVPGLPLWAKAEEAPAETAPADFVGASSALTGIDTVDLTPTVAQDGVWLADQFYSLLFEAASGPALGLTYDYAQYVAQGYSPQQIGQLLLTDGQGGPRMDATGTGARLTMLMWLLGVWYGGTEATRMPYSARFIVDTYRHDLVVSARAYKNGWIWRFAQAHPMGFSNFNFGSWADQPPSLSYFMKIV